MTVTGNLKEELTRLKSVIKKGIAGGMIKLQDEVYDYEKKRLDLFHHTSKRESYAGLIKSPLVSTKNKVYCNVDQKSGAGLILEYKLNPANSKPWFISLNIGSQKNAHDWLKRETNGKTFVGIKKDSQISRSGPMKNVKPMQDSFNNVVVKNGKNIISNGIKLEIEKNY